MAVDFSEFTQKTSAQSTDYIVGYDVNASGGEKKYTVSTLANAVSSVASLGTVKSVTGTAPISVANGTTTPAISISNATTTSVGVAELATLAEVQTGIGANTIVTPENLITLLNTLSTNIMNTVGNYPYLEYAWVTAPNAAGQSITANTITTLTIDTEIADTGNFGSISSNQITLAAGTYQFEAHTGILGYESNYIGDYVFSLYNNTGGQYITKKQSSANSYGGSANAELRGKFTLSTTSTVELKFLAAGSGKIGRGLLNTPLVMTNSTANADQRTTIKLWKVG